MIHAAHDAAGFRRARLVLVINRPRWGGGRRLEGNLAHALVPRISPEDVVVVYTDGTGVTAEGRFPDGVREIDFVGLASHLAPEDAAAALVVLLRTFCADAIVNINSATLYRAMQSLGPALTASERLFLCFFCNERTPEGGLTGWSLRYFYRLFEHVAGVITDSDFLAQELRKTYRCRTRTSIGFTSCVHRLIPRCPSWPSRPRAQTGVPKSLGRVYGIGRSAQPCCSRWHGECPTSTSASGASRSCTVGMAGPTDPPPDGHVRAHLRDPARRGRRVALHLEVGRRSEPALKAAMMGIPIVVILVGGTGEIFSQADAWPVGETAPAEAYVDAIRAVLADPADSRRRARALRDRMLGERTQDAFADQAADMFAEPRPERSGGMSGTYLTLIVTAHNETLVSGPTLASADLAERAARDAGYTVQTIIALDRATEETAKYFHQADFDHWERWEMDEGDSGARSQRPRAAHGRTLYRVPRRGDYLFSENWLVKGLDHLEAAQERGQRTIAHPEVIATFDGAVGIHQNVDQRSPLFTPYFLYMRNAYDSLCLTPREAHLTVPYVHRDIARGLSWQDWQFAIETMSRGWEHVVVPDTVIFKRRRDFSLMVESAGRKSLLRSLPEMAIDQVRDLPHLGGD